MDRQEVAEKISTMGEVDILVGIPSYNSAKTIAHVVKAVEAGLSSIFPLQIVAGIPMALHRRDDGGRQGYDG